LEGGAAASNGRGKRERGKRKREERERGEQERMVENLGVFERER
jgi:hypothetical protein